MSSLSGAGKDHAFRIVGGKRLQLVLGELAEIDALRRVGNHQIRRARKPGNTLAEGFGEVRGTLGRIDRLVQHGLDDGQLVLRAVRHLAHEEADLVFRLAARRGGARQRRRDLLDLGDHVRP